MATFTVTSALDDNGAGITLREAIQLARVNAGADIINFDPAVFDQTTITLTLGSLLIISGNDLTINGDTDGDGDFDVALSGDRNGDGLHDALDTHHFNINFGASVTLNSLALVDGYGVRPDVFTPLGSTPPPIAGSIVSHGPLTINNCVFLDNAANTLEIFPPDPNYDEEGGGAAAGHIFSSNILNITDTHMVGGEARGDVGTRGRTGGFVGGPGGYGGYGVGGIINKSVLTMDHLQMADHHGRGGQGGWGGGTTAQYESLGGRGGDGGDGIGTILASNIYGSIEDTNSSAVAGAGGLGGTPHNPGPGYGIFGPSGLPGSAFPGIIFFNGGPTIVNNLGTFEGDVVSGITGTYYGMGGNDILTGITGSTLHGGTGNDTLTAGGISSVFGGLGNDIIKGLDLANILSGGIGNDTIEGGAGGDVLDGGPGGDVLNGGSDGDTVTYQSSAAGVVINIQTNTASGGDAVGDTISGFENVTGSNTFGDTLTGDGNSNVLQGLGGDDTLKGGAGGDTLDGGVGGSDTADYRTSTGSNVSVNLLLDTASGGEAAGDTLDNIENLFGSLLQRDILIGDNGNNLLKGFGGTDSLVGNGGDDYLDGGAGGDALNAGAGTNDWAGYRDNVSASIQIDLTLNTATGGDATGDSLFFVENLEGSLTRRDILIGNLVANTLIGNGGADSIRGEAGNDIIEGGTGADSLNGGAGIDTVVYERSSAGVTVNLNVALQASDGEASGDSLFFFENVTGSGFDDSLGGNIFSNRLVGGAGADTLNGALGSDYLTGGANADTFRFSDMGFGSDTILDWQDGLDHISIALPLETSFAGLTFTGNGGSSVVVRGFNGTGSAIIVKADAAFTLDASDFIFI